MLPSPQRLQRGPPISLGGGFYVDKSMVQNSGTMAFSNCSSELDGSEAQAEDQTCSDGIW